MRYLRYHVNIVSKFKNIFCSDQTADKILTRFCKRGWYLLITFIKKNLFNDVHICTKSLKEFYFY